MQRRFIRWGILTLLLLAITSAMGIVVKAVIKPVQPDYGRYYGYTRPPAATQSVNTARYDLQPGPQVFSASVKPTPVEVAEIANVLQNVLASHDNLISGIGAEWQFRSSFDPRRMAEEWVRFGISALRGQNTTEQTLQNDERTLLDDLVDRAKADLQTFRPSRIDIIWVERSTSGQDCVVLAKHSRVIQGARQTWHTRWWFHSQYGQWKIYDYEEQPHRLRVNAILASHRCVQNSAGILFSQNADADAAIQQLVARTGAIMQTGVWPPRASSDLIQKFRFVTPLDTMRQAFLNEPGQSADAARAVAILNENLAQWPGTLAIHLMIASLNGDRSSIRKYRDIAGNHPWADYLEAASFRKQNNNKRAKAILTKGLAENEGEPMLLEGLYEVSSSAERPAIGTQAARGIAPSQAIRRLADRHIKDGDFAVTVAAFREIRPKDPEACLAQAAIEADAGQRKSAKSLLAAALAEAPRDWQSEAAQRFVSYYCARSGQTREAILNDPDLGPLLKSP